MSILLLSVALIIGSGFAALLAQKRPGLATFLSVGGLFVGGIAALVPVLGILLGGPAESVHWAWNIPNGSFALKLDPLAAVFLVPTLLIAMVAGLYGAEYLKPYFGNKPIGVAWFFYNLLVASMVVVVLAGNAVLFLMAWEVMSLASFFLVTFEDDQASVREAGWIYLVATHLGTAFLFVLFLVLAKASGSMDFDQWSTAAALPTNIASLAFVLAVIGFGTKAGFMPLHVWLPEAHPAAPSHVSALMSAVMIKMGIYGLFRTLSCLGPPPAWWGFLLIGIGLASGILGVVFALAQRDIKRVLAYSSVENVGIITLGLGAGLVGISTNVPGLAVFGFAGSLLHVVNHALFKGLLFLGAGSVVHAAHTRDAEQLGGLLKHMPWTGATFLAGSAAICGLPPFNGFVSEWLIFLGAYLSASTLSVGGAAPGWVVLAGLGLIGGLAAACFTRLFGIVFLGEPRSEASRHTHEAGWAMRLPMGFLALSCVAIGLFPGAVLACLEPVLAAWPGLARGAVSTHLAHARTFLGQASYAAVLLLLLVAALTFFRQRLLRRRTVAQGPTWDCGYARPTARMQYTASSFGQPLTALFRLLLRTGQSWAPPKGYFPTAAALTTDTRDLCHDGLYRPAYQGLSWALAKMHWLQHGHVQLYVLYLALTLLVLLVWKLG